MILAVDVGNSSTTVGLFHREGKLAFLSTLDTVKNRSRDRCAIDLMNIFQLYGASVHSVSGAILSCVVPPLTAVVSDTILRLTGYTPMIVGPGIKTGINIRSKIHNQLGSDIVAYSAAAIAKYPSPCVVIDMGTATSMCLLRGDVCEGCIIMPGLDLALDALSERAAALPPISMESTAPVELLGRTTEDAMRSGILYGHASMIDGMLDRLEAFADKAVTSVATGSNAPKVLKFCRHDIIYDANLVIEGLCLLYQKNMDKHRR